MSASPEGHAEHIAGEKTLSAEEMYEEAKKMIIDLGPRLDEIAATTMFIGIRNTFSGMIQEAGDNPREANIRRVCGLVDAIFFPKPAENRAGFEETSILDTDAEKMKEIIRYAAQITEKIIEENKVK